MSKEGYALTLLKDVVEVTRPRGQTGFGLTYRITGSDKESVQAASEFLDAEMSSLGAVKVERGNRNSKQFSFSEKTWNAPWNPQGPKPPWAHNPENN